MRWEGREESENVDDRRMGGGARMAVGGGIGAVVIAVIAMLFGVDPTTILGGGGGQPGATPGGSYSASPQEEQLKHFSKVVLKDTEDVWTDVFAQAGRRYEKPTLVLYRDTTRSGCGGAESAMGPFYCPADRCVYLDLAFYAELRDKLGAPGDFAFAYVIAHEVGHHVQNLLGYSDKVHSQHGRVSDEEYNRLSVRMELQADFLAGVFANRDQKMKHVLETGDLDKAIQAAEAVGDDRLQKRARGYAVPDSFTHGTSAQRARWFRRGFETGDLRQGDTFNVPYGSL